MDSKLIEFMGNPAMLRLMLEIQEQGQTTSKKLAETYPDIPQATLYRYLSRMLNEGVLKIVEENKIRGTVEKVYALNFALELKKGDMQKENAGKEYLRVFTQYSMGLLREFQEYTARDDIDIPTDGSGFWLTPLYLTKKELKKMVGDIQAILNPLLANTPTAERRLRNIGVVISPPKAKQKATGEGEEGVKIDGTKP